MFLKNLFRFILFYFQILFGVSKIILIQFLARISTYIPIYQKIFTNLKNVLENMFDIFKKCLSF